MLDVKFITEEELTDELYEEVDAIIAYIPDKDDDSKKAILQVLGDHMDKLITDNVATIIVTFNTHDAYVKCMSERFGENVI